MNFPGQGQLKRELPARPKKSLGQHFLTDQRVIERIIRVCDLRPEDSVLEIGPGRGVLTLALAQKVKQVFAVETDARLIANLRAVVPADRVTVVHADFLKFPLAALPSGLRIVSNLPYNIATPILEKIIQAKQQFSDCHVMVQWEYGQRMAAKPGTKAYGAFSCFAQYYAQPRILFKISPAAFCPAPKVYSCFMAVDLRISLPTPEGDAAFLFQVVHAAFNYRRKTLVNALGDLVDKKKTLAVLRQLGWNPQIRGESLSLKQFILLAEALA
ncbi:MAG: ribosomal RNA small subunit methyltransferase A [Candidatus Omnitrophica bacterium]|nr:ribosomal RNA small subunit methyltransferase A [Candidatus Omnitrophota bacterium]